MDSNTNVEQLKRAIQLAEQIETLQAELAQVISTLGGISPQLESPGLAAQPERRRKMSAAGRKRIAAAQRARWAKQRASQIETPALVSPAPAEPRKKRKLSAEGRARIVAALKRRWANRNY
jgi:hypothetical protein